MHCRRWVAAWRCTSYTARKHPNKIQPCHPTHCLTGHSRPHWEYLYSSQRAVKSSSPPTFVQSRLFHPTNITFHFCVPFFPLSSPPYPSHHRSFRLWTDEKSSCISLEDASWYVQQLFQQQWKETKHKAHIPALTHWPCMTEQGFQTWAPRTKTQSKLVTSSNFWKQMTILLEPLRHLYCFNNRYGSQLLCCAQYQQPKAFKSILSVSLNLKEQLCRLSNNTKTTQDCGSTNYGQGGNSSARVQTITGFTPCFTSPPLLNCFTEKANLTTAVLSGKGATPLVSKKMSCGLFCVFKPPHQEKKKQLKHYLFYLNWYNTTIWKAQI